MLYSGTVPQRGGLPVTRTVREALAGGARWAACGWGGNVRLGRQVAVVMGDVRRPSPRPRCAMWAQHRLGGEGACSGLPHGAGSQRMARGGASSSPYARAHPGGHRRNMARVWRVMGGGAAWPAGVLGQGWACGRITQDRKMQREELRKGDCTIVQGRVP